LVLLATDNLPETRVSRGVGVTDHPGNYLMVGVEDPFATGDSAAAESEQEWAHVGLGAQRREQGTVMCAALAWSGDSSPEAVRAVCDRVYEIYGALATTLNDPANTDLGVEGLLWTSCGSRTRLTPDQDASGSFALLTFSVGFEAQF
jgi:hypothetical protein